MQNIVLITRENDGKVTHVSVTLYNNYHEAEKLCCLVNRLFLAGNEKLIARCISAGKEYSLEKGPAFNYDDLIKLDNRIIQKIMREIDSEVLVTALLGSGEAIKERFFSNMSLRAAGMLQEDMAYFGPVFESETEEAKQHILAVYDRLLHEFDYTREFQSIFDRYAEEKTKKQNGTDSQDRYEGGAYLALVFDSVIHLIDADEESGVPVLRQNIKQARQKIVNTIIAVEKQFKRGKFSKDAEILKV
jgi:hypothetical protein